jgi:isopenicillin-N epimerase
LTTDHAYNACRNALEFVAARASAEIIVVHIPLPVRDPEEITARVLAAATPRVRIALVDHVTSPTGIVFPIADIVARLRERGIETIVDGAHAPGMLPLALTELGAGYYTGNFHKWVCAPKGAGMLVVRSDLQSGVHPPVISHGFSSTRSRSRFLEEFDWTGSDDPSAWLAVPSAIRFMGGLVEGGWPAVYARNHALAIDARRILLGSLGGEPLAPDSMLGSLAALSLPDATPGAAASPSDELLHCRLFSQHRIEVPVFPWPAPPKRLVRISAQLYNTLSDFVRLADALRIELAPAGA